ncbi:SWIM-type domain-containing protein [Trichostrongylus colubriformis]|uniref:SWIM-type domain-containing protein n=1 Tax=Trichostrongylus colubriformis TaxID=6319 RepID=A0AAN8ILV5_TRICO
MVRRRRRRGRITTSRRRYVVPYQFEILLDRIQSHLGNIADNSLKAAFPILEALGGIVGRKAILEAVRWLEAGSVRLVEEDSCHRSKRSNGWQHFQAKERFFTQEGGLSQDSSFRPSFEVSSESPSARSLANDLFFYEVTPIRASHNAHQLLPNVNYCACKEFEVNRTMKRRKRITCSHFLAVWLCKSLHSCNRVAVRKKTIDLIRRHMVSRSEEFF